MFRLTPILAILNGVIQHHLTWYLLKEPNIVRLLAEGFYVDDFVSGALTAEEGLSIYQKANGIMKHGGLNLRKWKMNSPHVQQSIDKMEDSSNSTDEIPKGEGRGEVKLLGLYWSTLTDMFYFDFRDVIAFFKTLPPTKRTVLRVLTKVFDPLGLLSPFTVGTKILFQTLCKRKINWDDVLDGTLRHKWNYLVKEFESLTQITIPRCYYVTELDPEPQQINGFSDASEKAYAAVIHLRSTYSNGSMSVHIIA